MRRIRPLHEIPGLKADEQGIVASHVLRFIGGGELRYVYNSRGQVIELSSTGIRSSVSAERVVMFSAP